MVKDSEFKGQRFGRLVVIERDCLREIRKEHDSNWICKCDCGEMTVVSRGNLLSGDIKSCGCLRKEYMKNKKTTHGMTNTRLYQIWFGIKKRCNNKNSVNYDIYGGRGIAICSEWQEFEPFYEWAMANGYSDDLTIDRIDVNGNYEPDNCRWATMKEQANNTRRNHYLTFNGKTQTISQWATEVDLPYSVLKGRINKYNWSVEDALTTPVKERKIKYD